MTNRYGRRAVVRGRIVNCAGKSIVRARIDVIHVLKNGKRKLIKTGLRSRDGGKLTLILPMNVKTRDLRFEYRGNLLSSKGDLRLHAAHQGPQPQGQAPPLTLLLRRQRTLVEPPGPKRPGGFCVRPAPPTRRGRARTTRGTARRGGRRPSGRPSARGSASPCRCVRRAAGPGPGREPRRAARRADRRALSTSIRSPALSSACSMLLVTSSETMSLTSPVRPGASGSASTARRASTMLPASGRQQVGRLELGHTLLPATRAARGPCGIS